MSLTHLYRGTVGQLEKIQRRLHFLEHSRVHIGWRKNLKECTSFEYVLLLNFWNLTYTFLFDSFNTISVNFLHSRCKCVQVQKHERPRKLYEIWHVHYLHTEFLLKPFLFTVGIDDVMNGPQRTACFAKGMHKIPEVRNGSCTGSQNWKLYRKSVPEVVPEVRTGCCSTTGTVI